MTVNERPVLLKPLLKLHVMKIASRQKILIPQPLVFQLQFSQCFKGLQKIACFFRSSKLELCKIRDNLQQKNLWAGKKVALNTPNQTLTHKNCQNRSGVLFLKAAFIGDVT